ncbi:dihydroxyacetone kinase subunit DhaK [candidate division KSB3 bacterium]|uniref:Dihydroxyacetone kinase subunit DhaK n=1 Tax=candidate division KSB3 bacterium TaxID=2044937 RepID=A0A2G6E3R3_9BACT|nr:MAG: dihydroxyacetone kinase subunit DhaK [candidate division KSB3 bacterium]PIE28884.1 MAG: dihydroxyacetone kinase subunit DhaK [candidate division KSB3 bacterium]
MKKFLNDPELFVDEMIQGIVAAHPRQLKYVADDYRCIVRADEIPSGKVALASGGGSGHLPLFLGYVGQGLLDGCAVGGVFQSPSAQQMVEVTKAIDRGAGVLYIYGNYTGDIMNFEMASEMLEMDDIQTAHVLGAEDVASAPKGEEEKRRGVAGIFYVYKIAGAYADEMVSLEEVKRIAEKVCASVRTMGVALSPCTIPEVGKPTFEIGDNEMEIGMGIHGEPGVRRGPLKTADDVVEEILSTILADLPYQRGDEVSVLMNGLGATPKEELYVMFRKVHEMLNAEGISVYHTYVGEFATSMEMTGASISLLKLDDELKRLLAKPAWTPFFEQGQL